MPSARTSSRSPTSTAAVRVHPALADADVVVSGHRGRDSAPRRSGCAARRRRRAGAALGERVLAARDLRVERLAARARARTGPGPPRRIARRLADAEHAGPRWRTPRLSARSEAVRRIANFPLGGLFGLLPGPVRRGVLRHLPSELSASAVFAGPPSVAHAEALLRGVDSKATRLEERLDVICIGVPHTTAMLPREAPNPMSAAYLGPRARAPPLARRVSGQRGRHGDPPQPLHQAVPAPDPAALPRALPGGALERGARPGGARRSGAAGRLATIAPSSPTAAGRSCHPLLPFAEWSACQPAIERLGAVLIAGCRDSSAARQLGFVPAHGIGPALEMAHGRAAGPPRIGYLLRPRTSRCDVGVEPR